MGSHALLNKYKCNSQDQASEDEKVSNCFEKKAVAGIRVLANRTHFGKLPRVGKLPKFPNVWFITGFGSRGLIHHALVADHLVQASLNKDESLIPEMLRK